MDPLLACSGAGDAEAIANSVKVSYRHFWGTGVLLLISLLITGFDGRWIVPALLIGLLIFHPTWTISADSDDCGAYKRQACWAFTAVGCVAVGWQVSLGLWAALRSSYDD